jgi:hypothetical protein
VSKINTETVKLMSDGYFHVAFVCVSYRLKTVHITSAIWCMNFNYMN